MQLKEKKPTRRILFVDRDGVIVEEDQVDSYEKIRFIPHVMEALRTIRRSGDWELVLVSNQDGVGTPSFPMEDFQRVHDRIMETLRGEDVAFDEEWIDFSLPEDNCPGRKPGTAMLSGYLDGSWDIAHSFMIGDRQSDMDLARALGCQGIWFHSGKCGGDRVALETDSWLEVARFLCPDATLCHRTASLERRTKETDIRLRVNIDGSGQGCIETGIGFFDHMLEQIVRHARFDVEAAVKGDLEVDEHHSVEDLALCLGKCVLTALGDKRGISRYGYEVLTMDEVHACVALDFSGRPDFVWEVDFSRQYIGVFPTEMITHFFKSFSNEARCNLYMSVGPGNCHHQAEALFKAFARALRSAVRRLPGSDELPSTKGVL